MAEIKTDSLHLFSGISTSLISELNGEYATKLATLGVFDVERIKVKIGKDVSMWMLR